MHRFPEGSALTRSLAHTRISETTILKKWMKMRGKTCDDVAKGINCSTRSIKYWMNGQALPCLVSAYKIEAFTNGAVPVASWLGTAIGKAKWNDITSTGKDHGKTKS